MNASKFFAPLVLATLTALPSAVGQVSFTGSYSQDFSGLQITGATSFAWADNSTVPGWYAGVRASGNTYVTPSVYFTRSLTAGQSVGASAGPQSTALATATTDRSLGLQPSASTSVASANVPMAIGLRLTNSTGSTIGSINLSFAAEQWSQGYSTVAHSEKIAFSYSTTATGLSVVGGNVFTAVDGLLFTSPTATQSSNSTTTLALNGNDSANRTVFTTTLTISGGWANGTDLWLRWYIPEDLQGTSPRGGIISVDDLTITTGAVAAPPSITTQPASLTVSTGAPVSFSVVAAGDPVLTYQWRKNTNPILGATSATYSIASVVAGDAGSYDVVVTNSSGTATSTAATLTVTAPVAPTITTPPANQTVSEDNTVTFTVAVSGSAPFSYQWRKGGVDLTNGGRISGATSATLSIANSVVADSDTYSVVVTNAVGSAPAASAVLTVNAIVTAPAAPTATAATGITANSFAAHWTTPSDATSYRLDVSTSSSFATFVAGYQDLDVGNVASYTVSGLTTGTAYYYRVRAVNVVGASASSNTVTLTTVLLVSPTAPTATAATSITANSFAAHWTAPSDATSYRLDVSTSSSFATFVAGYQDLDVGNVASYTVSGLTTGTAYYYRVRAVNVVGASASSNTVTLSTVLVVSPHITSSASSTFTVGVPSTFQVTTTGSPTPTLSSAGLPSWLGFDAATGILSGTAPAGSENAQFLITLTASNGGIPDVQTFTVSVQALPTVADPLTVTTLAGAAGTAGSADGTGPTARFRSPLGIVADSAATIYVADTDNHVIRKVTTAGVVTTVAGKVGVSGSADGTGTAATFNSPSSLALDANGNLYVADTVNHLIRRVVLSTGAVTTIAGSAAQPGTTDGSGSAARFNAPQGIALDAAGDLYVADTNSHAIRKITVNSGAVSTIAGHAGVPGSFDATGTTATFRFPSGIAVGANGVVYVADTENNTIRQIATNGAVSTLAGYPGASGAADGVGSAARFKQPSVLATDATGARLFVLDTDNHTIREIATATGSVATRAGLAGTRGTTDGEGTTARFGFPSGIAWSSPGVAIADTANHTIRLALPKFAPIFITQPQSQTVTEFTAATFTAAARGNPAPTYQWYFNGTAIAGATSSTYSITSALPSNEGTYTIVSTNAQGSTTSDAARLTVANPPATSVTLTPPTGGGGSGGGGGAVGIWFYFALALAGLARGVTRRPTS